MTGYGDEMRGNASTTISCLSSYLFWTDHGEDSNFGAKIEVSDLMGNNRRTLVRDDIRRPRGITIDFDEDVLYWVDSEKDTIECSDFNGLSRRVVAHQAGTIFFGIAVFDVRILIFVVFSTKLIHVPGKIQIWTSGDFVLIWMFLFLTFWGREHQNLFW